MIGGAIAGPPGAVVAAVGAGGAGVGDQAEEESEETTRLERGPHRSLNLRRTKGRLAALRDNSPADARAAGLFHARIALLDSRLRQATVARRTRRTGARSPGAPSSGWAKRSIRRRSAGRAHRSTGCSGWLPGAPGRLTTAAFRAQRSSPETPAPSFESAAFEATDQVADGPPPWLDRLATGALVELVAGPLRESLDRLAQRLGSRPAIPGSRSARRRSARTAPWPPTRASTRPSWTSAHWTFRGRRPLLGSLWSPAAIAYRRRRGLPANDVAMAVVVQGLVPADAAAVAFTRHPVTGREDQVVISRARARGRDGRGHRHPGHVSSTRRRGRPSGSSPARIRPGRRSTRQIWPRSWTSPSRAESGFGAPVDIEAAQSGAFLVPRPPDHGSGNGMAANSGRNRAGRSSGATSSRSPSTIPPRPRSPGSATTCTRRLR